MDPMRFRRAAVLTAFAMLAALAPVLTSVCVGWDGSAKVRMACCATAHAGGTAAAADACCTAGEQRSHASQDSGLVASLSPDLPIVSAVPVVRARARVGTFEASGRRAPEISTHLLLSVFLL